MKRGDIYWCNFAGAEGHEQKGTRPALIVSCNKSNKHAGIVGVLPITKAEHSLYMPTKVFIKKREHLKYNSYIMAEQIITRDKKRLERYIASLNNKEMDLVNNAIITHLQLIGGNEMNDITVLNNEIKMTSLHLSDITGKQHYDLMKSIRNEVEKLGELAEGIFSLGSYKDKNNQERPCYKFGRKGAMQLALKYDAVTRFKVIEKLEELEQKQKIPQTFREALLLAAEQQGKIEEQQKQLEEQKPKIKFYNAVENAENCITIGEMSKLLQQNGLEKMGRNNFFKWLRENEYLISSNCAERNTPTQKAMRLKIFKVYETTTEDSNGISFVNYKTRVTGKGQTYFIKKLVENVS